MGFFGKRKNKVTGSTVSSSSKVSNPTDPQNTIVTLRQSIGTQDKREEHITRKVAQVTDEARKKMAKGDKKGALFAMKRKKMYENEIDKIQNVKMTLETQVMNLESAAQNATTFNAMAQGNKTMKKIRKDVGIEKVDDVMDDIKAEMELADEVNEALQSMDPCLGDEDELLEELQALEMADLDAELLAKPIASTPAAPSLSLPTVPDSKLLHVANDEQEALKNLEAELVGL